VEAVWIPELWLILFATVLALIPPACPQVVVAAVAVNWEDW
jgi:hypothetical protein